MKHVLDAFKEYLARVPCNREIMEEILEGEASYFPFAKDQRVTVRRAKNGDMVYGRIAPGGGFVPLPENEMKGFSEKYSADILPFARTH